MNPNCKTLHLFPLTVFTTLIWSVSAAWRDLYTNIPQWFPILTKAGRSPRTANIWRFVRLG
jgi:hypothetical protein